MFITIAIGGVDRAAAAITPQSTGAGVQPGGLRITRFNAEIAPVTNFAIIEHSVPATAVCMIDLLEQRTATAAFPLHTGTCIALTGGRRWYVHVNVANLGTRFNVITTGGVTGLPRGVAVPTALNAQAVRGATIAVGGVAIITNLCTRFNAIAALGGTGGWFSGTVVPRLRSTSGRTAIPIGGVTVIAAFSAGHIAISTGRAASGWRT